MTDIFDDLKAEYEQLDAVLAGLTPAEWSHPSAAEGWTVSDVVLHLAQNEELTAASLAGEDVTIRREPAADRVPGPGRESGRGESGRGVDAAADAMVAAQRDIAPADLLARWRRAASLPPPPYAPSPRAFGCPGWPSRCPR